MTEHPYNEDEIDEESIERRMLDRREIVYLRDEVVLLRKAVTRITPDVARIKGTLNVLMAFLVAGISVGLWLIQDMRNEVTNLEMMSAVKHELIETDVRGNRADQLRQDNAITKALNIVSLNQKRVMRELQLPYLAPEKVGGMD